MEKGDHRPMKTSRQKFQSLKHGFLAMALVFMAPTLALPQIRSGAAFLKILPGARPQAMGESYTGMFDDLNAILANPGSAGFLREWQWAANYNKWIADVYQASFLYGRQWRTPWSRASRVVVGTVFQGMAEFNSADQPAARADASDWLLLANLGQPLTFLSDRLSLGINFKYFRSRLDKFRANTLIFDTGLLYRSKLFHLHHAAGKPFSLGQISAGLAINQLGPSIKFISAGTPLPRTLRAGVNFNAGSHGGLQMQLALDYQHIRDDGGRVSLGGEVTMKQLITLRAGYLFKQDPAHLLNRFTFGLSFRLDDLHANLAERIPGRNNAVRLDMAALQSQPLFSNTYRGSLNHFPIGPSHFQLLQPLPGQRIEADSLFLDWEPSTDPDLYDEVRYWLLVDTTRAALAQTLEILDHHPRDLPEHLASVQVFAKFFRQAPGQRLRALKNGRYFWSVIAFDRDGHARAMEAHGQPIAFFDIRSPDLQLTEFNFHPQEWITQDDLQGTLQVTVLNQSQQALDSIAVAIFDSSQVAFSAKNGLALDGNAHRNLVQKVILPEIQPGEQKQVEVEWHTSKLGLHHLVAQVDAEQRVAEANEANNYLHRDFYTIPKGSLSAEDTSTAMIFSHITYDLPFIAEVCFDSSSSKVKHEYIRDGLLPAPLTILSERLREHPNLQVYIRGFADPNSGEHDLALARQRAVAVRDTLINMGVNPGQVVISGAEVLPPRRLPRDPMDRVWILQERRHAKISASRGTEAVLFQPMRFVDIEPLSVPVTFFADLSSALPYQQAFIHITHPAFQDTVDLGAINRNGHMMGIVGWRYPKSTPQQNKDEWRNQNIAYEVIVTDSLGRRFHTHAKKLYLVSKSVLRDEKYAWPLKFAQTDPLFEFYWTKLYSHVSRMLEDENMRMRFVGHACAIGPEWVNQALSERRAKTFQDRFLQYVKRNYPQSYAKMKPRMDSPKGMGEKVPLNIRHTSGRVLILGNNNDPLGRMLNRRIEIDFYSPDKPLQEGAPPGSQ